MNSIGVGKTKLRVGFKGIVNTADECVLDMAYADKAYNFSFDNGVLTGKIGIDRAAGYFPESPVFRHDYPVPPSGNKIKDVFLYKRMTSAGAYDDRIVAHLTDGHFMYTSVFKNDTWHDINSLVMRGDVCAVSYNYNGEDVLLLSSNVDYLYFIKGSDPLVCTEAPKFTSITVHNERIYGSVNGTQNQVWFSDDFNPSNWSVSSDEAGSINFADECGEVIKVVSFLNYVYIFREYGIFRLTAYGDQSEFLLKKVFTDTGRIIKNSIELCGDKIVFYAEDGLYAFDGYTVTRIAKELMPLFRTHLMSAAYLDDCYYLACATDGEGTGNDSVIRYRFADKSISVLKGCDVSVLKAVRMHNGAQVLCVFSDGGTLGMMSTSGKIMGESTVKRYVSPYVSQQPAGIKTVRSVTLSSRTPVILTVKLDGKEYDYAIGGSEQERTVYIEKSGRKVGFELTCESAEAHIPPLSVAVDVLQN